jgi:hypothetical protein
VGRELVYPSSRGDSVCPIVEVHVVVERGGLGEGGVDEGREDGVTDASMVCRYRLVMLQFERGGGP